MVPRIGGQGSSFRGAAAYYLHDKQAETNSRVAFTLSRNLSTDDPEMAWRWMAKTALDAERLKAASRADMRGAKSEKPVFTFSLSWHPDEAPEDAHMIETMEQALERLGLQDHQALLVSHSDEPQPHVHAIVNLVHPETGRTAPLKFSKEKLSKFAQAYEEEHGVFCHQRIKNNAQRDEEKQRRDALPAEAKKSTKADYARNKEAEHALKAEITARYVSSDSGSAFQSSLKEMGFTLAQGRRVVVVDAAGKEYSLARQLEGVKAKDIRARLADIVLPNIDDLRREIQERGDRQPAPAEGKEKEPEAKDAKDTKPTDPAQERSDLLNALQNRRRDTLADLTTRQDQARGALTGTFEKQYGEHEQQLRAVITQRETLFRNASRLRAWFLRTFTQEERQLEADRRTLKSIEQRRAEMSGALELRLKTERAAAEERFEQDREALERRFAPVEPVSDEAQQREELRRAYEANPLNLTFNQVANQARQIEAPSPSPPSPASASSDDYAARRAAFMERAIAQREALEGEEREGPTLSEGD